MTSSVCEAPGAFQLNQWIDFRQITTRERTTYDVRTRRVNTNDDDDEEEENDADDTDDANVDR